MEVGDDFIPQKVLLTKQGLHISQKFYWGNKITRLILWTPPQKILFSIGWSKPPKLLWLNEKSWKAEKMGSWVDRQFSKSQENEKMRKGVCGGACATELLNHQYYTISCTNISSKRNEICIKNSNLFYQNIYLTNLTHV